MKTLVFAFDPSEELSTPGIHSVDIALAKRLEDQGKAEIMGWQQLIPNRYVEGSQAWMDARDELRARREAAGIKEPEPDPIPVFINPHAKFRVRGPNRDRKSK